MDDLPPTSPNAWGSATYGYDPEYTEFLMSNDNHLDMEDENLLLLQHDSLSYLPMNPNSPSQLWMSSILNPGIIDSRVESRSSTLSSYPESSTFNSENLVPSHQFCLPETVPEMPALPEPVHTCNTTDTRRVVYIDEEEEEEVLEPGIEGLACPQFCGAILRRVPDVKRHMKEQHLCAHPNCKDKKFRTKFVRDKHEEESHPDEVLRFQCGSCGLMGSPKRFVRVDKLRSHFKSIHKVQGELVFKGFQCEEQSCLPVSDGGGMLFATRAHLDEHVQSKHGKKSTADLCKGRDNVPPSQEDSQLSASCKRHYLPHNSVSDSKRTRISIPIKSLSACQPLSGQFELNLIESITIIDVCSFVEDARFPHIMKELALIQVWAVFVRSSRTIKICGARSPDDMNRAVTLLNPLLPVKNKKSSLVPRRSLPMRSRPREVPLVPTSSTQILPIKSTEDKEAIYTWRNYIAPELPEIMESLNIGDTCSVTLVRQKGNLNLFEPVIRFQSPGQTRTTRSVIRKKVREISLKNDRPEIPIHFSNGRVVLLGGVQSPPSQHFADDASTDSRVAHERRYYARPGMGISIGMTQCEHETATSGGYILVDNRPLMLTVQHLEHKARTCHECPNVRNLDNSLSSPAPADIRDLREQFEAGLSELDNDLENSDSVASQVDITSWAKAYPVYATLAKQLKTFQEQLSKPPDFYKLGKVVDHSDESDFVRPAHRQGGEKILRHRMDWALYEVNKERLGKNRFPHPVGAEVCPKDIENEITNAYGTGEACQNWREFRSGEAVYYVGSHSGYREGIIDEICSLVRHTQGGVSEEWCIVPKTMVNEDQVRGDSGAWVLGKVDNDLLGLLWGYADGKILFTPIAEVFEHIIQKWGPVNIQVAPLDPGSARRPQTSIPISRTKLRRVRPSRKSFFPIKPKDMLPIRLSVEIPLDSESSCGSSTSSLSCPPSPTPSLTSSVSSISESSSPSIIPLKLRSWIPNDLLDPFGKLDLKSQYLTVPSISLPNGNEYLGQRPNDGSLEVV